MPAVVCLVALALLSLSLPATADTISAERPGFASGPTPLARGLMQIEAGYQYTEDGRVEAHQLPQLVLRSGIADNLELQVAWAGYSQIDFPGGSVDGISDLTLGLKTQLPGESSSPWTAGLYGGVSLPVGDSEFSSDAVDPTVGFFWTYARNNQPTIFGTVVASSTSFADDRSLTGGASVGMGFAIDTRWGAYLELFSLFGEGSAPAHNANGGFTYLVNDDLQLDFEGGVGLSDNAGDFFVGFGAARRW